MLIDWFTVGAQVLNFIILVWLMKRFLYQPVLNAIDAREKMIADELARADRLSQEATQAKASFEAKNLEFDQQREQMFKDATAAADEERQRLLEESRQMAEQLESKQQKALQDKMQNLHNSIRTSTQNELFAMTKNALRDLAAVDIETQMITVFLQQLQTMTNEQKKTLQTTLKAKQISVVSSKPLSSDQQSSIDKTLKEVLGNKEKNNDFQLQFEQSADLVAGIELTANGFKIGWSVAEYVQSLQDSLADEMNKHVTTSIPADKTIPVATDNSSPAKDKATVDEPAP